ncbi:MAG: GntR family transcriptional regulator [Nitrososphaerota archaeon]
MQKKAPADELTCYSRLREAILSGEFMPNEHLVEADLARSLDTGRAAVRAALSRLEHEGLVERMRHRGARVRRISEAEAIEILEVRAALEALTARQAAKNVTPDDVAELHSILDELRQHSRANDLLAYSDTNGRLHRKIISIARHHTAERMIATLNAQNVRFQYRTILAPGRPAHSLQEHEVIVQAISMGDADAAETAMRTHLSHVAETLRTIATGNSEHAPTERIAQ